MALIGALAGLPVLAGCAGKPHFVVESPVPGAAALQPGPGVTRHVVLVSIDGLRPDAIDRYGAATLQRLAREGSWTYAATTIMPSKTLPSHTSMLTGEFPAEHGMQWNTNRTGARGLVEVPTVFGVARARGYQTAAFFSKAKFQHLQQPGTLDYSQAPGGRYGGWSARKTMEDVEEYLTDARPHLLFVHLREPDYAGHLYGWMTPAYASAVRVADQAVAKIIALADRAYGRGGYTLIVTADHGGHGYNHGSDDPRDVTIPWIAWGAGVQPGPLGGRVETVDTAATVLWLLGLREPSDWAGTPVTTAFDAATAAAAASATGGGGQ
ncbi:MAG: ectonucleotide pyrophosphatase/phosphodiesterase [Vicinamibacterales bacterium]|nr:ectonucleotide pyrophosphatase/phosphodiesterase [Vicinamibacterales bacterium]